MKDETLVLSDDSLSIAATEARHPLESAHGVQGHDEQADIDAGHGTPHHAQLHTGVDSVGWHRVIGPTVGDVSSEPLMTKGDVVFIEDHTTL